MRKFLDHVRNNSMCNVFVDIYVSLNKISYCKPVSGHINFKKRENEQELQKSSCAILSRHGEKCRKFDFEQVVKF